MIKCFCPACGAEIEIQFFVPSKIKLDCPLCTKPLLISAKDKEVVIKYPIYKVNTRTNK